MKVILTEKVKSLGNIGEMVNVSPGFARNYLIPKQFAVTADDTNKKQAEHHQKMLANKMAEHKSEAEVLAKKVEGVSIQMIKRIGASGKLFGSVTTVEISHELALKGIDVEKRLLLIEKPIKALGTFKVKAKIYSGVEANFTVEVQADPKQMEELKKRAEEIALQKAAAEAQNAAAALDEGTSSRDSDELTEDEKLKAEANKILRS